MTTSITANEAFERTNFAGSTYRNAILVALPLVEQRDITAIAEKVSLESGEVLYEPAKNAGYVYFPEQGVVLLLAETSDGTLAQTTFIGPYGIVGSELAFSAGRPICRAMVAVGGEAIRIRIAPFLDAYSKHAKFRARCDAYREFMLFQAHQNAACYARHSAENRFCRWLLQAHDLTGLDRFPVTQEFLGEILAVRRSTVSAIASKMKSAGYIDYKRGKILVSNPEGLERHACDCCAAFTEKRNGLIRVLQH